MPHYAQLLTRMDMADLRINAEESANKLYISMLDHIGLLEDKIRVQENKIALLERKNRELRGQSGV